MSTTNSKMQYGPADRPPFGEWLPLSVQHVFAMFGSTILVPILVGLQPTTALFTAGTGTLIYILLTKAKVPAFLGSSFAFITPLIAISSQYGWPYAMGGAFCSGLMYALIAFIISRAGSGWIHRALPPVVIGSVIVVIGLNLAPTAMGMAMYENTSDPSTYSLVYLSIALFTLAVTVVFNVFFKGFFSVIPMRSSTSHP